MRRLRPSQAPLIAIVTGVVLGVSAAGFAPWPLSVRLLFAAIVIVVAGVVIGALYEDDPIPGDLEYLVSRGVLTQAAADQLLAAALPDDEPPTST